jgi:hypothetical protein
MTNYQSSLIERIKRRTQIIKSLDTPRKKAVAIEYYRHNLIDFINDVCWTYDPRVSPPNIPFYLFPKQEEYLLWRRERRSLKQNGLTEKSRDAGISWLNVCDQVHCWLFEEGFTGCFGSRKEELVDRLGDPKSIFEKVRFLLRFLPKWMLPKDFNWKRHSNYMKLINPNNGSTITGEGGVNMGRGGRSAVYDWDETAHTEQQQAVDAALSNNTNVIYYTSSANGVGNLFYKKRMSYPEDWVFRFHWRDDPRKDDEWYRQQQIKFDPVTVAQEVDIDYTASIEGIFIPAKWVMAAVNLQLPRSGKIVAGLDIAAKGKNKTVFTMRHGSVVLPPIAWQGISTTQSTFKVVELMREMSIPHLNFDVDGLGEGVEGVAETLSSTNNLTFTYCPIHGASTPSDIYWEGESRTSAEKFANKRAELWGLMRERFRKTYNHVNGIAQYPLDELISIPNEPALIAQLSQPLAKYAISGKTLVESKEDMRKRGVESPDYADSLATTFEEQRPMIWEVRESYWGY